MDPALSLPEAARRIERAVSTAAITVPPPRRGLSVDGYPDSPTSASRPRSNTGSRTPTMFGLGVPAEKIPPTGRSLKPRDSIQCLPSASSPAIVFVTKWRKAVEEEKARRAGGGSSTPKPAQKEEPKSQGQEEQWRGPDPAKRKYDTDGVDIKRTGQPTRDNCVGLIYNGLAFNSRASCTSVILKALELLHS